MSHVCQMLLLLLSWDAVSGGDVCTGDVCTAADVLPMNSSSMLQTRSSESNTNVQMAERARPEVVLPTGAKLTGTWEAVDSGESSFIVDKFYDIEYATAERWAAPSIKKDQTTRELSEEPTALCPQMDSVDATWAWDNIGLQENCLFLDVYTPSTDDQTGPRTSWNLPVMVYIHGGALVIGSKHNFNFVDGLKSFILEDVIVVPINHRLNAFGFWTNPLNPEAEGLWGLQDQIEALRWVKENIRSFGGNPESVTIFGQSSGGLSVTALYASPVPKEEHLFHRAIAQSPGYQSSALFHEPAVMAGESYGRKCMQMAAYEWPCWGKTEAALVECVRTRTSDASVTRHCAFTAQYGWPQKWLHGGSTGKAVFAGWDGTFLKRGLYVSACEDDDNTGSDVPLLIGGLEHEWTFFDRASVDKNVKYEKDKYLEYFLKTRVTGKSNEDNYTEANDTEKKCVKQVVKDFYENADAFSEESEEERLAQLLTDIMFTIGPQLLSTVKGANKYRYIMNTQGTGAQPNDDKDSAHGDDLCFFHLETMDYWNEGKEAGKNGKLGCRGRAKPEAGKMLRQLWTQFAKNGVPSSPDNPDLEWSPVDRTQHDLLGMPYMHLDFSTTGPHAEMREKPWSTAGSAAMMADLICKRKTLQDILRDHDC